MCLGDKLERGGRESTVETAKNHFFFFFGKMRGLEIFICGKLTLWLLAHLVWPSATLLTSAISAFSGPALNAYLKVFLDSNWIDLGVPRKLWMSSFQKTKEIKFPMVRSKVMTLGSVLMHFWRFSQYLNHFNSDFNPWIVVGMRIWLSLQWHWFQLVLIAGSKLGFLGPIKSQLRVKLGQNC